MSPGTPVSGAPGVDGPVGGAEGLDRLGDAAPVGAVAVGCPHATDRMISPTASIGRAAATTLDMETTLGSTRTTVPPT